MRAVYAELSGRFVLQNRRMRRRCEVWKKRHQVNECGRFTVFISQRESVAIAAPYRPTICRIPRPIREELAALDGATVLDRVGTVLAGGRICGCPAEAKAAAACRLKALSRLGLAVKISADGGISAFTDGGTDADPEVAFQVCV